MSDKTKGIITIILIIVLSVGLKNFLSFNTISKASQVRNLADKCYTEGVLRSHGEENNSINLKAYVHNENQFVQGTIQLIDELQAKKIKLKENKIIIKSRYTNSMKEDTVVIDVGRIGHYRIKNYEDLKQLGTH